MIEKPPSTAKLMISNFVRNTTGMIGLAIVFLVVTSSIFAVQISGYDPNMFDGANTSLPPSTTHLMGTDQLGQDVFSRVLYGGRNSILIGVLASFLGNLIGTVLGAIAGYVRGKFDTILIRLSELVMTFPQLVLVLIFVTFLGQGVANVIFIFAITGWMTTFRLVRSEFMSLREEAFVEADRAFGFSSKRIIFRHLLPNTMSPIVVAFTINTAIYIIAEAGLSFLGLGVPVTTPTWGNLLAAAQAPVVVEQYWWLWVFPAAAIVVFVTGVNFIGDGLRDVLDPRSRTQVKEASFGSTLKQKIFGSRKRNA
ncbi:MAG: ABC transporter permease [Candidatus Nanopelagicaceae bacterium]|nr:ABC transporter permease [Candidatus Nanopelagicaceae bacterium]